MDKMAKIRHILPNDIKKIQELIEYIKPGFSATRLFEENFTAFPLDFLHNLLPLNLKFFQESYIAVENKEILGMISLIPENKKKIRWKINRLILSSNQSEVGKQLIDYVVNKYGGAGVETFMSTIHDDHPEAIAIFKNQCGFRSCSQIQVWSANAAEIEMENFDSTFIRKLKKSDAINVQELDQICLFPHYRSSLVNSASDFKFGLKSKIINKLRNQTNKRFVLENPRLKSIEGYFTVMNKANNDYWVDIVVSMPYQDHYKDILLYITNYIKQINNQAQINVMLRRYYQSNKRLMETLTQLKFTQGQSFQVLVKDYWNSTSLRSEKKRPIAIFTDITSTACNMLNKK